MDKVYIVMEYQDSSYPEFDNNEPRAVFLDHDQAMRECMRLGRDGE